MQPTINGANKNKMATFKTIEIEPISAEQQSLVKIFSDTYAFSIPPYQRPYAWEKTQAEELLNDITEALEEAVISQGPITYFLGSIVLIKSPGSPLSDVVDGQQRLTTLTILLAVLRDLSNERSALSRHDYICEQGNADRGTTDRLRLIPRKQDAEFFRSHIQELGGTKNIKGNEGETGSQQCMIKNAHFFRETLKEWSDSKRDELVAFLIQRCYLVVISVSNVETAHRVFTVLNARGLDLTPTDILKADLLDRLSVEKEESSANQWEAIENALGRDKFVELFQHIRMIFQKEKPRERLEVGFPKHVTLFKSDPDKFLKEVLSLYGRTFIIIISSRDVIKFGEKSRALIGHLLRLDNSDWLPIAIYYLSKSEITTEKAEEFLAALERLAYFMFVRRFDINSRISRYSKAISELQKGVDPTSDQCALALKPKEKIEFLDDLDGNIYEKTKVRLPLLLRLDSALSDGAANYQDGIVTVEHIMPQNPKAGSSWLTMFEDEEERYEWTHCLGNLVLLTRAKNSQASNWDFERKKDEYFSTKAGVSSFRLTSMVLKAKAWDFDTLEAHHCKLIQKLADVWDLDYDEWAGV